MNPNPDILDMWTVFERPPDFPRCYVARRWEIVRGVPEPRPTSDIRIAPTLDGIRLLKPDGLVTVPRFPDDAPNVVEAWL